MTTFIVQCPAEDRTGTTRKYLKSWKYNKKYILISKLNISDLLLAQMLLRWYHRLPFDGVIGLAEKTDNVVDFRDSLSSISLLKVTQLFEKMKPAEILEIQGADIDNQQDLFKVLPKMSYECR